MRIGCLINVRLGSKRLPKKHLRDIAGKMAIERLIERVKLCEGVDFIIATGADKENNPLKAIATKQGVGVFFGDPANIPNRHLQCAREYKLDAIVSLDGDDVLVSPKALRDVVAALTGGKQLIRTEGLPLGMNVLWAYTVNMLIKAIQSAEGDGSLETGWGWFLPENEIHRIAYDIKDSNLIRATMDYPEDLAFLRAVYSECPVDGFNDDAKLCSWIVSNRVHRVNKKWHL